VVPVVAVRPTAALVRVGLHLLLAALPLLTISAHVFGLVPMHVSAGLLVIPLLIVVGLLALFSPAGEERLIGRAVGWGLVATLVYDVVRLDTVYLLGWWGDFIPTVGTWILHTGPDPGVGDGVVGYLWRYVGDGGGIGVTFFVLAAATGLHRRGTRTTVAAAVVFAVVPVWAGLIATVALAPRGQALMFPLTPTTVCLSLLGHLVFGLVLGLGAARCGDLQQWWPWAPLVDLDALVARGHAVAARPPAPPRPASPAPRPPLPPPRVRADPDRGPLDRARPDPERTAVHPHRPRRRPGAPLPAARRPTTPGGAAPARVEPASTPPWWPATSRPAHAPWVPPSPADRWGPPECVTHGAAARRRPTAAAASATSSLKAPPTAGARR
jgi:hypothetical protein